MALVDYKVFGQKLQYFHVLGTLAIVLCTIVISLSGVIEGGDEATEVGVEVVAPAVPTWVPVIFGLITPVSFTCNGILTKHLTSDKVGFNPSTISFSAYFVVNIIVLIVAIPYWVQVDFSQSLFWIGFIGSVINTLGIVCI
jgi:drug/metabolite transporter (DMT)-like permease